ncbi:class C sortase [Enterococcus sp. LJL99]
MTKRQVKKQKANGKKLISQLLILFLFLLGLLVMCYPFYVDAINGLIDQNRIKRFQKDMGEKNQETLEKQQKKMTEKNQELSKNGLVSSADPFTDLSEAEISKDQQMRNHLIGAISIPKIKVTIPLFDTTNENLLQNGATVLDGTSYPTGGENTHTVIAGHRGLAERKLFTDLDELKKGDIFVLTVLKEHLAYEVDKIQVVEPSDTSVLKVQPNKDLATLITCTPYMINSHRLLITGHRVPYTQEIAKKITKSNNDRFMQRITLLIGLILLLLLLFYLFVKSIYTAKLRKQKIDLVLKFKGATGEPISRKKVALYTKNGKRPLIRNGKPLIRKTNDKGQVIFKQLPGGLYQAKLLTSPETKMLVGTKKIKQKRAQAYPNKKQTEQVKNKQKIIIKHFNLLINAFI